MQLEQHLSLNMILWLVIFLPGNILSKNPLNSRGLIPKSDFSDPTLPWPKLDLEEEFVSSHSDPWSSWKPHTPPPASHTPTLDTPPTSTLATQPTSTLTTTMAEENMTSRITENDFEPITKPNDYGVSVRGITSATFRRYELPISTEEIVVHPEPVTQRGRPGVKVTHWNRDPGRTSGTKTQAQNFQAVPPKSFLGKIFHDNRRDIVPKLTDYQNNRRLYVSKVTDIQGNQRDYLPKLKELPDSRGNYVPKLRESPNSRGDNIPRPREWPDSRGKFVPHLSELQGSQGDYASKLREFSNSPIKFDSVPNYYAPNSSHSIPRDYKYIPRDYKSNNKISDLKFRRNDSVKDHLKKTNSLRDSPVGQGKDFPKSEYSGSTRGVYTDKSIDLVAHPNSLIESKIKLKNTNSKKENSLPKSNNKYGVRNKDSSELITKNLTPTERNTFIGNQYRLRNRIDTPDKYENSTIYKIVEDHIYSKDSSEKFLTVPKIYADMAFSGQSDLISVPFQSIRRFGSLVESLESSENTGKVPLVLKGEEYYGIFNSADQQTITIPGELIVLGVERAQALEDRREQTQSKGLDLRESVLNVINSIQNYIWGEPPSPSRNRVEPSYTDSDFSNPGTNGQERPLRDAPSNKLNNVKNKPILLPNQFDSVSAKLHFLDKSKTRDFNAPDSFEKSQYLRTSESKSYPVIHKKKKAGFEGWKTNPHFTTNTGDGIRTSGSWKRGQSTRRSGSEQVPVRPSALVWGDLEETLTRVQAEHNRDYPVKLNVTEREP